jgi:hypothetical protein
MERFQGKLMRGGKVVFDNLAGTITPQNVGGQETWGGLFTVPSGIHVAKGGPFELFLDDGRKGTVNITDVSKPSHRPTIVNFQGSGQLK